MKYLYIVWIYIALVCCSATCSTDVGNNDYTPKTPVKQNRSAKRGVSFGFQFIDDIRVLSEGMSWSYNWAPAQIASYDEVVNKHGIDYCPMAWNGVDENALREYVSRHPECKYLLAFNEPNLTDQANMTPQQAAQKWVDIKSIADELGLKIISPAMNYGTLENYHDPINWLDEFFELVPINDIDGISIHCYMASPSAVKWYIDRFKKYDKPIWLTEFCAWDGLNEDNFSIEGQQKYMSDVFNYLESDPMVYRYAWFIPRGEGSENNFPYMFLLKNSADAELTKLGKIFNQISTQDKNTFYVEQQTIEAEHYSSISIADGVDTEDWVSGPMVRATSEQNDESLELYNFLPDQWVEYQIELDRTKEFSLDIRHANQSDAVISIYVDGKANTSYVLQNTAEDYIWETSSIPLSIKEGKHTLKITINKGNICMNWLRIS
ncbi:carbohydrate-binding protein [Labilibacter sediminis]|nr:carbohydrate-binding protein [Labilibacter sediminis]